MTWLLSFSERGGKNEELVLTGHLLSRSSGFCSGAENHLLWKKTQIFFFFSSDNQEATDSWNAFQEFHDRSGKEPDVQGALLCPVY